MIEFDHRNATVSGIYVRRGMHQSACESWLHTLLLNSTLRDVTLVASLQLWMWCLYCREYTLFTPYKSGVFLLSGEWIYQCITLSMSAWPCLGSREAKHNRVPPLEILESSFLNDCYLLKKKWNARMNKIISSVSNDGMDMDKLHKTENTERQWDSYNRG